MKLSDLTTEKAADVLCELTPYVLNITGDKDLLDELKVKIGEGKSVAEIYAFGAAKIAAIVPILLKNHRADVFGILAVMNETTPEEIGVQPVMKTMAQVKEAAMDKELLDFFGWYQQPVSE